MYKWQQLKVLRAKGESIKEIARQPNLSKNTVRKYLRSSGPPEFKGCDYDWYRCESSARIRNNRSIYCSGYF